MSQFTPLQCLYTPGVVFALEDGRSLFEELVLERFLFCLAPPPVLGIGSRTSESCNDSVRDVFRSRTEIFQSRSLVTSSRSLVTTFGGSTLAPDGLSAKSLSAFVPCPPPSCPATRKCCVTAQADSVATEHGCALRWRPALAEEPGSRYEVAQTTRHCRVTIAMTREWQTARWLSHGVAWTIWPLTVMAA